ncbi:hypothetical protein KUTeg_006284 [Tegillarca granosa]|uniref:PiggyBac transposable element-derived protein domain-containing protein n=1 Tax=Tegillarca granosa TaxID=220873 RepID=A0ABQ9FJ12_TEGGR|nr:hypothetical protein KUTeg_006284 [Tegillarca granosa]
MDLQQAFTAVLKSDNEDNFSNSDNDENETSITTGKTTGTLQWYKEQRRLKNGSVKDLPATSVSEFYNKYMFGVDIADQKEMQYSTYRKAKKWYKYWFWFCFDMAVVKSLVCMQESPNHK